MTGKPSFECIFMAISKPCLVLEPRDGIFIIAAANEAYLKTTGTSREEILGKISHEVFTGNPQGDNYGFGFLQESFRKVYHNKVKDRRYRLRFDIPVRETGVFMEKFWNVENVPVLNPSGEVDFVLHMAEDVTEQVMAERRKEEMKRELEKNRQQFRHFVEANPDGLYSLDPEGKFLTANQGIARIAEVPLEELLRIDFLPFCDPRDREFILQRFTRAIRGESNKFEARFVSARGRPLILEISLAPMTAGGKIIGAFGIAKDLTTKRAIRKALREQEEALQLSERKYKALIQGGAEMITIFDKERNFSFVSDSTIHILGIPSEEFLGKPAADFVHPKDLEAILKQLKAAEKVHHLKLQPFRFRNKGGWRWIETILTDMTDDPAVEGFVGNSRDVTDLVRQREEIRKINERYRLAATATQDLMYEWDLVTDQVVRFHKTGTEFLGHPDREVDRRSFWREHIHPEDLPRLLELQEVILRDPKKDFIRAEYRFRRADCSYASLIDSAYILRDAAGKPIRMVGATSDFSDLRTKEEALKIANRRFKLAMKASKEVIWDWNLETGRIDRSRVFKKISGYHEGSQLKDPNFLFTKVHPEEAEQVEQSLRKAVATPHQRKWRAEYRLIKANGEIAHLVDRGYIVRDVRGKAIRMVGSVLDDTPTRTALKRIEQQNKVLLEIAWEQSHLVRAPLARIKGLLEFLSSGGVEEKAREEILGYLNDSAEELDEIIRRIVRKTERIG